MPELKRTILRLGAESAGSSLLAPFFGYVLLNDLAVRNDAAHHKIVYKNRTMIYLYGAIKKAIASDLTIRLNAIVSGTTHVIGTFTIPAATAVDTVLEFSSFDYTHCPHKSTISLDITASDGSRDVYGIAEWLLVFSPSDSGGSSPSTSPGSVTNTSGNLTADEPVFGAGGVDVKVGSRSGNTTQVATVSGSLTDGHMVTADAAGNLVSGGPVSAGMPAGGSAGQVLAKTSGDDYDTEWENPPISQVQSDWEQADNTQPDYIQHKPPVAVPSDATPTADSGAGAAGTSAAYSRADHVHPVAVSVTDLLAEAAGELIYDGGATILCVRTA